MRVVPHPKQKGENTIINIKQSENVPSLVYRPCLYLTWGQKRKRRRQAAHVQQVDEDEEKGVKLFNFLSNISLSSWLEAAKYFGLMEKRENLEARNLIWFTQYLCYLNNKIRACGRLPVRLKLTNQCHYRPRKTILVGCDALSAKEGRRSIYRLRLRKRDLSPRERRSQKGSASKYKISRCCLCNRSKMQVAWGHEFISRAFSVDSEES